MVRVAFTLIELIFAIIVLSIAFLAIPQLFTISSSNIEEILKDEATFQGMRSLGTIQTYVWDENSPNSDGNWTYILDTDGGDSELNRLATTTPYRQGNFILAKKRKFFDTITKASATLGSDSGDTTFDDIDDFDGATEHISSLIVDLDIAAHIYYIDDNATYQSNTLSFTITTTSKSSSTNIKMIEVSVKDSDANQILLYRTISCNIGMVGIKTETLR